MDKKTLNAYKKVFSSEEGKEVLADLMKVGRVFESTFDANNPCKTAYNEGIRNIVLRIINFLGDSEKIKMYDKVKQKYKEYDEFGF